MKVFRFLEFRVYKDAKDFYNGIIKIASETPKRFDYLSLQLKRASLSVILNIAEGSAKNSDKDFNRYIQNSLGSINESLACLEILLEHKLITKDKFQKLFLEAEKIAKQLGGLSKKLKSEK